jgi:bifunctional ADP-heptose synthase (sugar kinase/adenylyltransferase)
MTKTSRTTSWSTGGAVHLLPAVAREVYDVWGAGDTIIATLARGPLADREA